MQARGVLGANPKTSLYTLQIDPITELICTSVGTFTQQRNTSLLTTSPSIIVCATPTDTGHPRSLLMTVRDHLEMTFLMVGNPPRILAFPPNNLMCWCLLVDHTHSSSQTSDLLTLQTEPCLT